MKNMVHCIGFVDFDASGTVDLVLVVGEPGNLNLNIMYNMNKEPTEICKEFEEFPYNVGDMQELIMPH